MGQEEIPMYVKPVLSYQVNIGDSIVKKCNDIYDGDLIRCVGMEWKGDKMCRIEL